MIGAKKGPREPGLNFPENDVSKVMCRPPIWSMANFSTSCCMSSILRILPVHHWLSESANALAVYFLILSFCLIPFSTRFDVQDFFDRNSFVQFRRRQSRSSNINEERVMITFLKRLRQTTDGFFAKYLYTWKENITAKIKCI